MHCWDYMADKLYINLVLLTGGAMADFIVGSVVRDEDFWFRDEFISVLWNSLEKHNVLLVAPRRIGKTSVMYRLLDFPEDDWLVVHLNVEELRTPDEFLIDLLDAVNEHQPDYFRKAFAGSWSFLKRVLSRIESVEASEIKVALRKSEDLSKSWRTRLDELMESVYRSGERTLFIIDELPDMLNAMRAGSRDECAGFLHWFRKTREQSLRKYVRWLVGGSVNLIATLDRNNTVNLINDLKVENLEPFTEEEVKRFVSAMLERYEVAFDRTVIPRMLDLLGSPIPFFLQMLTEELYRHWKRRKSSLSSEDVTNIFQKVLLGETARDKLQHYRSRIDVHYPEEDKEPARRMLNHLSRSDNSVMRENLFHIFRQCESRRTSARSGADLDNAFQHLLLYLQSDFYIEGTAEGRYDFSSRLLKTWWRKYCGFEYAYE